MWTSIELSSGQTKRASWHWLSTRAAILLATLLVAACGTNGETQAGNEDSSGNSGDAESGSLEDYFSGETITFIAVSDAGGGQDIICRTIANHIAQYIPGEPEIVVRNVPGAGGLVGENEIANSEPDGFTWGPAFPTTGVFASLSGEGQAEFELDKLTWIGNGLSEPRMLWARTESFPDLDSLLAADRPMRMGSTGPEHPDTVVARAVAQTLGFEADIITGYDGTGEVMLDVERGVLDGRVSAWVSIRVEQPNWITDDFARPLVFIGEERHPEYSDVAALGELGDNNDLVSAAVIPYDLSRSFNGPPGIDQDIVDMMKDAYEKTVNDPAFQEEMGALGYSFEFTSGEQLEADVDRVLNEPAVRDGILALMAEG